MTSPIPAEYAWILPILIPLILGLIVGVIVKRALKLILVIVLLLVVLVAIGYLNLSSLTDIANSALKYLPLIWSGAGPFTNLLPYSSISFIIGLIIGLWKG
ncbi:MAG: hypothetical protein ABSB40_04765 [Nitrososphaeria archaeon]